MEWYNKPLQWEANEENTLVRVNADPKTDFWRITHYGFIRDNGHFYYQKIEGDFLIEVKISGEYTALYDQAGIMIRLDEKYWIKSGIEFVNGVQQVSAVVTREYSDWSIAPLPHNPPSIWLRCKRQAEAIEIEYSLDGQQYNLLRLAYLSTEPVLAVGIICAAPDGEGFRTTFENLKITAL